MEKKKIFIGVAWPYVNGDLHPGHLAGYLLPADIFARFNRLIGNEVLMVSGSDCYGTPTTVEAEKRHISPQQVVDEYHPKRLKLFHSFGVSFDLFTKTATENHKQVVQKMFIKLVENGYVFIKNDEQYFSEKENKFLPDRYVEGECPFCGNTEARGDQCDKCGRVIEPKELKNPHSRLGNQKITLKETEHYYLDWKKLQSFLEKYFAQRRNSWRNWVQEETAGWLKKGLEPRPITRDLEWGIEIPLSELPAEFQIKHGANKRIYVWFEAVIGYLSAAIEWAKGTERWKEYWYSDKAKHYYFMGKDNLVFHTLFWPGQLYGYDETIHLPDYPVINHFLNLEGQKFSKSKGITLDSFKLIAKYGADAIRFYLCSIMPENSDASWSNKGFTDFYNDLLIGKFGNLINRVLVLAKNLDVSQNFISNYKVQPHFASSESEGFVRGKQFSNLVASNATVAIQHCFQYLSSCQFKLYAQEIIKLSEFGNEYLAKTEPWKLNGKEKENVLINALLVVLTLLNISQPLLIDSQKIVCQDLGIAAWNKWLSFNEIVDLLKKIKITHAPTKLFVKIN